MSGSSARDGKAACPRCGYDQRGAMVDWSEACPLDGTCTECGLGYAWSEILGRTHDAPRWSAEGRPLWHAPLALFTTTFRALLPLRFWRDFRLQHRVRPGRLIAFAVMVFVALYLSFAALVGVGAARNWTSMRQWGPTVGHGAYVFRCAALPLSGRSLGTANAPQPRVLRSGQVVVNPAAMPLNPPRVFTARWWRGLRAALPPLACIATVTIAVPLVFLALPVTMRRAKVRWGHIGRIFVYSLIWPGLALLLREVVMVGLMDPSVWKRWPEPHAFVKWFLLGMLGLWWLGAVRRYLRLPHALGVALALLTIGVLLGTSVETYLWLELVY